MVQRMRSRVVYSSVVSHHTSSGHNSCRRTSVGQRDWNNHGATSGLNIYGLPKRDLSSGSENIEQFPHWHWDLDAQVRDFQVDPSQDLMVLVEQVPISYVDHENSG